MNNREKRIRAGVKVIEDWIKADPRGYIKADDHEVASRILDAADDAVAAVNADDVVDSLRLALSAHPIAPDIAESVIATLVDALDNNL
jgi:hypothetical protein